MFGFERVGKFYTVKNWWGKSESGDVWKVIKCFGPTGDVGDTVWQAEKVKGRVGVGSKMNLGELDFIREVNYKVGDNE